MSADIRASIRTALANEKLNAYVSIADRQELEDAIMEQIITDLGRSTPHPDVLTLDAIYAEQPVPGSLAFLPSDGEVVTIEPKLFPRSPEPADFVVEWDADHTFDFFEDDNADGLWAHGSLPDETFVAQANEYDRINNAGSPIPLTPYTVADVTSFWAIVPERKVDDEFRLQRCLDTVSGAVLCKKISR